MPRIDRLSIQGFRAFGPTPATLDFEAPIAVVWGANSEGKTSLAEAVEFLFTGDIARRELLSSAVDEFENALRNAHLPTGTETYVEASITGSDGMTHILRRTLLEDFTKRKVCTSKLELDGAEISASDLVQIGLELSDPPLAAPVLMQHTLGYLFSASPKERASYFKSILEVVDLDSVREAVRSIDKDIPAPLSTLRDMVVSIKTALPSVSAALASVASGIPSIAEIESAFSTAAKKLLSDAGETPAATLADQLSQVEGMTAAKQAETFPLHGFTRKVQTAEYTTPADSVWAAIDDYKAKLEDVDRETQQMTAFFQQVLKLPAVVVSTEDIDCPVCETPAGLTQVRIQAIRNLVKDTETFRVAESKARGALGTLMTSAENLGITARTVCPDFFDWDRTRRISEGFRTDRMALLLDEASRPLLRPWFDSTAHFMRAQRHVCVLKDKAIETIVGFQADVAKLENDDTLRTAFEPLEAAHQHFVAAIETYKEALEPLIQPLKDSVAEKSDTTGWATLVTVGRNASDLKSELREAAAHALLSFELEQACKQVESAKEAVLEDKFDDLAEDVRSWWNRLRPEEAAFFSGLGLRKKAQRTIDFKAGLAPSRDQKNAKLPNAIAVFSQSQMHCLGLATFFARTGVGGGFLLLDDPIITFDDDYSVHFFTAVLRELEQRNVQVIMLTYNRKTWTEIQSRYDDGRSEAFQLLLNNPTEGTTILKSSDTLTAMLKACEPFTTSSLLEHRKDCCQKVRDCAERWCKELLVKNRHKQGDDTAMLSDYTGSGGTLGSLIPLVTPYLASDEPGKLKAIRDNTNPGNHDDDVPPKTSLKVYLGDLKALKTNYLR
jgi:hypothetical protein